MDFIGKYKEVPDMSRDRRGYDQDPRLDTAILVFTVLTLRMLFFESYGF